MRPDPVDATVPPVAAVCLYPNLVAGREGAPRGKRREGRVGRDRLPVRPVADEAQGRRDACRRSSSARTRWTWSSTAARSTPGRYSKVYDEIVQIKEACGDAHLKVILETGELGTYDNVRRASLLAIAAGADFIKTSTGKINPAATLPVTLCMMEVVRDVYHETGRKVGIKPAGGIRASKQAVQYLVVLYETLGPRVDDPRSLPLRRLVAAQ